MIIVKGKHNDKKVNELQQPEKPLSLELIEFLKEIHESSVRNTNAMQQLIKEAEAELAYRKSQGENCKLKGTYN